MLLRIAKIFLLLLVFSLCYLQPFAQAFDFQIPPTEFLFLFTFGFWFLAVFARQTKIRFHRFYWFLLFYFAAMLISAALSDNRRLSFIKLAGEIYLLCLPVLIFNLVETEKDLQRLIRAWLSGTAFVIATGILVLLIFYLNRDHWLLSYTVSSFGAVPVGNYPRLRLNFLTPSLLCNYLSVSFSLLLITAKLNLIKKTIFLIFAAFLLLIAAFTISSGLGGFALIAGLWIFYLYRQENKLSARLSLIGGIAAAFLFWLMNFVALQPHSTAPFSLHLAGLTFYPSPRLLIWTESWQTFSANFMFGRGVGQDACLVVFENTDGNLSTLTDAHNTFLSVAAQEGIGGLAAIILIIYFLVKDNLAAFSTPARISIISTGLLIAFVAAFVYQGLVGSFEDSRHLWVLIGLMLCAENLSHRAE